MANVATVLANIAALKGRAQTALSNNATFLAIASPTNAQVLTQVQALTRQANGLIRLQLTQFDTISDS